MKEFDFYFVDTNIFLRVLIKEDEKTFEECFRFLKMIKEGKIRAFTSSLVLAEVNWVLGGFYKFPKTKVVNALKSILNLKGLKIVDKYNSRLAVSVYEKFSVKFIDALFVSNFLDYKKEINTIIVSYDKDFDKIGVKRKEPSEFL